MLSASNPLHSQHKALGFSFSLDILERLFFLGLYGWMITRFLSSWMVGASSLSLLLLVSEGLALALILVRRSATQVSRRPLDWATTLFAMSLPLLCQPVAGAAWVPVNVAGLIFASGFLIQIHAKVVLGRSFGGAPAHRGLRLSGPYRLVRHPMYAGYLMTHLAFLSINATLFNLTVFTLCYAFQIPRIFAEERILGTDPDYRRYMEHVRWRLVPGLF